MGDVSKLPKWAQDELTRFQRRADEANARADAIVGATVTTVEIEPYKHDDEKRCYLPDHATVRFRLGTGEIDVRIMHGRLFVMGTHMRGIFNIHPSSSNVVTIGFEQDR